MKELNEKGVSNNKRFRAISDALDRLPGFKDSAFRANIHGIYHDMVGYQKEKHGNKEGAEAERKRAQQQYDKARMKINQRRGSV